MGHVDTIYGHNVGESYYTHLYTGVQRQNFIDTGTSLPSAYL
jgi:hypothetical protein